MGRIRRPEENETVHGPLNRPGPSQHSRAPRVFSRSEFCGLPSEDGKEAYSRTYNYCVLVGVLPDLGAAAMLEASLIREFKVTRDIKSCANVKGGGDNIVGTPPGFVYLVCMSLSLSVSE